MDRKDYFSQFYNKHKNKISAEKHERYVNDEAYRKSVIQSSKNYRDQLKKLKKDCFDHNGQSVISLESCADFLNLDLDQLRGLIKDARFPSHDKKNRAPIFTLKQARLLKKNLRQLIANSSDANERGFEALQRGFHAD